jgi:hypothetical protein
MALIVGVSLLLAQSLATPLFFALRPPDEASPSPPAIATRIGIAVRMLEAAPEAERPLLLRLLNSHGLAVRELPPANFMGHMIASELDRPDGDGIAITMAPGEHADLATITTALRDGPRIEFRTSVPPPPSLSFLRSAPLALSIVFLVLSVGMLSLWAARRVTAPLSAFVAAAERLGSEGAAPPRRERVPI